MPGITRSSSPGLTLLQGFTLSITCEASAEQQANFTWFKDDKEYMGGEIFTNTTFSELTIESVVLSDAGIYSCQVTNSSGYPDSSQNVTVIVGSRYLCPVSIVIYDKSV